MKTQHITVVGCSQRNPQREIYSHIYAYRKAGKSITSNFTSRSKKKKIKPTLQKIVGKEL